VVVGAGLAGAKAVETLRRAGCAGRIVLIGDERERPYDRPPLSKGYLAEAEEETPYLHEEGYYAAHDIELWTATRVASLDAASATITTDSGERLRYDALLLATGAWPRRLRAAGAQLEGVRYLRTLADAEMLRADLRGTGRVIVVGGGWIGTEIAAAVRQLGREVVLVHRGAMPLERVLGREVAGVYRDLHAENGVELVRGEVDAVLGRDHVEGVRTTDGTLLDGDLVVVGIGARPRTELAEVAGLTINDGIVVDEHLRTSAPGVFAAGDVARAWHPVFATSLRVDHWANALNQGGVAAANMLGRPTSYDRVPYAYSDQYDVAMEYSGHAPNWDRVVLRGDVAARQFIAFWLHQGRVVAGMNVNVRDVVKSIQALVRARRPVDLRRLADPAVPLDEVLDSEPAARAA
jgi:3-phenylpropionate/trans-cinnamate dioxygenase ferredoxin reductase subunit